jgi:serine/threonine protein kinase
LIFNAILERAPVAPVRLNPEVPAELERIINKCLEKDRSLRYQHASDVRTDLQRLKRDTESNTIVAAQASPDKKLWYGKLWVMLAACINTSAHQRMSGSHLDPEFWRARAW